MENEKILKEEKLTINNKKEGEMAKRRKRKSPFIDGWGLILLIIGIALLFLRQEIKIVGGIIALVGFIRIIYVLAIQDLDSIEKAINKIYPHLILKKKQANILLKYCKIRKQGKIYSDKENKLYLQIKELNRRGC